MKDDPFGANMDAPGHNHVSDKSCPACGSWWRLPLLFGAVFAAILLLQGGVRETATQSGKQTTDAREEALPAAPLSAEPTGKTVSLSIDVGGDVSLSGWQVAWHEGMTVADVLAAGKLPYSRQGSGAMTFLTEINGISNEGAGGRNWTYSVNGKKADRSYAVYELRPGDRVLWSFAAPE